eukprot:5871204-Prymnesium_polylepis.2
MANRARGVRAWVHALRPWRAVPVARACVVCARGGGCHAAVAPLSRRYRTVPVAGASSRGATLPTVPPPLPLFTPHPARGPRRVLAFTPRLARGPRRPSPPLATPRLSRKSGTPLPNMAPYGITLFSHVAQRSP